MIIQIVVALYCLYVLSRLLCKESTGLQPPELPGRLPIVGHALLIMGDGIKMYNSIKKISEECLDKGGVNSLNLGPKKVYGIADPEDCLAVINASPNKHYMYDFVKPLLGNGIFTANESIWKKHRKLLNPTFNQQILDGYIAVFNTQAQSLVEQFASEVGKPFDHEKSLRMTNLETICKTTFGVNMDENRNLPEQYLLSLMTTFMKINTRIQKFWLHSDLIYNLTNERRKRDVEIKRTVLLTNTIVQEKKMKRENKTDIKKETGEIKTFIDVLLDLEDDNGCFTDKQIRDEANTIAFAGHDTVSSLLTFVFTLLGSHTDVQDKVYEEVLSLFGNLDKNIHKEHLSKLVYIEAVLKETMRLYPIAPVLPRTINRDLNLKNYTLKANAECFVTVYGLHHHSIWGPDADQFRPERWLDKETLPDPKYFGGFGLGKRSCIGKTYAMMSMKIILAHVIRNYRISSDADKMVLGFYVMTKPESGYYITLARRTLP